MVQNLQGTRASPPMATSCLLRETLKTSPTSWIRNPNQVNGKSRVLKWRYVSTLYIYIYMVGTSNLGSCNGH